MSDGYARIMLWMCVDDLTQMQHRLGQGLIHCSCSVVNLCPRELWVLHVVVCPQRSGHVMLVRGSTHHALWIQLEVYSRAALHCRLRPSQALEGWAGQGGGQVPAS
jgi:hypothetical protein